MNKSKIDQLLDKYWEAETTIEEEKQLGLYFNGGTVDPDHEAYKDMFQLFRDNALQQMEGALYIDQKLIEAYDEDVKEAKVFRFRKLLQYAAILSFLVAGYFIFQQNTSNIFSQTGEAIYAGKFTEIDDEEMTQEAYEITKEALLFLTGKLNQSQNEVNQNLNKVKKVTQIIN